MELEYEEEVEWWRLEVKIEEGFSGWLSGWRHCHVALSH